MSYLTTIDDRIFFFQFVVVDMERVVREAKKIFCNTPRSASMRRHDRQYADPKAKHVRQQYTDRADKIIKKLRPI